MRRSAPLLQFVAGEPSGDNHAAAVLRELATRLPGLETYGYGGAAMQAAGMALQEDLARDAIMGFFPVIRALPRLRGLFNAAVKDLADRRPDALVLVDWPGFNLRLAAEARKIGIPVIWYIAPQVWAWAPQRMAKLAKRVDLLVCILPFEEALFANAGIRTVFTGHPMADHLAANPPDAVRVAELRAHRGAGPLIGVFPGSRAHVVESLSGPFGRALARLAAMPGMADLRAVFALSQPRFADIVQRNLPAGVRATMEVGHATDVMHAADVCLTTSGTTTLEIATVGRPFVIGYHVSRLFYFIASRLVTVPHIGLVNLVAGERLVPEHVGAGDLSTGLAEDVARLWNDADARATQVAGLARVRDRLTTHGAYARAADAIAGFVGERV